MDRSPPGSSVHGILQARILEWVAVSFSRGSSQPKDWTCLLHCRQILFQQSHQGNPYLAYSIILVSAVQHNDIMIQRLCTLQNDHHDKSSYHLSPCKVNTVLLTVLPMLYITSSWLIYFTTGSLSPLIPFTHLSPSSPLCSSNSPICVLYESTLCFAFLFRFHI